MYNIIKRIFDIIISFTLIIFLSPLLIIISIIIKLTSRGNVFYIHKRHGKNKMINVIKFRTMVKDSDKIEIPPDKLEEYNINFKIKDDSRVTKVGKFLRKYYIDELPQLLNVFVGNMSLVGPRPIITEELKKYKTRKRELLSVKPGITGYWQVNKYFNMPYEERIKMELFYVKNYSFLFDLKIILKTIKRVIEGEK